MPGSDLQRTLTRLVYRKNNEGRQFDPKHKRGVAPAVGVGTETGAGIASPLTEVDPQEFREYHPERDLSTTDGLFTLHVRPLKTLRMLDANGREVVFNYSDPDEGEGE